jgi:hypothetical protein
LTARQEQTSPTWPVRRLDAGAPHRPRNYRESTSGRAALWRPWSCHHAQARTTRPRSSQRANCSGVPQTRHHVTTMGRHALTTQFTFAAGLSKGRTRRAWQRDLPASRIARRDDNRRATSSLPEEVACSCSANHYRLTSCRRDGSVRHPFDTK